MNMNAGSTRVFSIGIGSSVDVQLVSELARAGHGKSSFSLIGNQELASIVIDHLSRTRYIFLIANVFCVFMSFKSLYFPPLLCHPIYRSLFLFFGIR